MEGADHFLVGQQGLNPAKDALAVWDCIPDTGLASPGISIPAAKPQANHCPGPTSKENNRWI